MQLTNLACIEKNRECSSLLSTLTDYEQHICHVINLVASENVLSPLAKLPFLLDLHSRYFLDDIRRFGKWYFPHGSHIQEIEQQFLIPLLKNMAEAKYVNIRPISGMNCMVIALSAFTKPGETILSIPLENGGHASTPSIADSIGRKCRFIPFSNAYDIDYPAFEKLVLQTQPGLVYLDQSTLLFPIDPQPIRELIDRLSPHTILHYDTSHTNGLILGKALFNPLQKGAHCYGGSTHKTLPGPHKGFLATNDETVSTRIESKADHFVSHHHPGSSLSLAITLMEMKHCQGELYARTVISNARAFAENLSKLGFYVAGKEKGYTQCHQIWATPCKNKSSKDYYQDLTQAGIMSNLFDALPGIGQPAFRLSVSELTRRGAESQDMQSLANIMSEILLNNTSSASIKEETKTLSEKLKDVKFCYTLDDLNHELISNKLMQVITSLY